jgi:hypothetical protein
MAAAVAVGDATEGELVVITGFDGTVRVTERHSARSRAQEARSGGPAPCEARFDCLPACDDRAYATYAPENPKVRRSQPWYFKASSTPGSLNRRKVERRVKKGAQNIPAAENDCGMSDPVKKGAPYKGRTRKAATSIRSTVCNPRHGDGRSVVDFGSLPRGVLGFTCFVAATSSPNGRFYIREADVRLRKGGPWTLRPSSPSCRRRFDLMGVVTHERGHAFGLAHPRYDKKQTHAQLTMHSAAFPCSPYIRTLGLGDVRGLNFLY